MARPISLKNRSIDLLRSRTPGAFITDPVQDTAKGAVAHMRPSTASVQRVLEPVPAPLVVFPRYRPGAGLEVTALPRMEVFRGLLENAFNYSLLGATGFGSWRTWWNGWRDAASAMGIWRRRSWP